jgi:L-threonylcarbamoyladenylate synthase
VRKIFIAKQRPQWDPLIVHVADIEMMHEVVSAITPNAHILMNAFWPGPLTLLLPKANRIPGLITAGRPLVGVRMPSHRVAHALIRAAGLPIAAPSANSFGRISPTLAMHVIEDLDGRIDAVIDGGETAHGLESTVVDVSGEVPVVYRPGVITLDQIRGVCPGAIAYAAALEPVPSGESLPSPGLDLRHYAPRARLVLVEVADAENIGLVLVEKIGLASANGEKVGVMLPQEFSLKADLVYRWGRWSNSEELAHRLFAGLRELDAAGATVIVCPLPAGEGIDGAIRDRLRKGARPRS